LLDKSLSRLFLTIELETPLSWVLCFNLDDDGAGWLLNAC
jgi:hypothetical protein